MEDLFQYLLSLAPLPAELQAALVTRTFKETHRAGKTLLAAGEVCDWIGFVESGLVKVGYDIPGGDERIVQFARAGEAVFGVGSFTTGLPSKMSVVAIERSVIRKIYKSEVDDLISRFPAFHVHVRKVIEAHTQLIEDHYLVHLLPARERYLNLIKSGSWLLGDKRIKDYMIADYLGVGRGTFSRFRNGKG
jgi:CRP-like cAMP-binding protein